MKSKKRLKNDSSQLLLTKLQSTLFPIINNYQDLMMTQEVSQNLVSFRFMNHFGLPFLENYTNAREIQSLYTLHVLNHAMKIKDRVIRNTARLTQPDVDPDLELRDQGE